jgi:copper chaperone CopZ
LKGRTLDDIRAQVSLDGKEVRVEFDSAITNIAALKSAVEAAGYEVSEP